MGDHGEVGEVPLDHGVEDGLGGGVAQGRPVLVQQVHQLFADHSGKHKVKFCNGLAIRLMSVKIIMLADLL